MQKDKFKLFSFFSGAGFLDLGFEKSGYDIVFVNEFYKPFMEAYKYSRSRMKLGSPEYGHFDNDITSLLDATQKSRIQDMVKEQRSNSNLIGFIGGPPCPDFSVGGKNKGKDGDRGRLSGTYINLICNIYPDFFLFENVKGLWRTKKHRQFYEDMKKELHEAGYATTERLINALEYGVPQDRERIILIGFRKSLLTDMDKKYTTDNLVDSFSWEKKIKYRKEYIDAFDWPSTDPFYPDSALQKAKGIIDELTVEHWFKMNDVTNHQNTEDCFRPKAGINRFLTIAEGDSSRKSFKRLHRWRYSPTAAYGNNEVHLHPYKARRLNVAEALAIQSLPKAFALPECMTLTDKFKTVGNGVPYLVAKSLAEIISEYIE